MAKPVQTRCPKCNPTPGVKKRGWLVKRYNHATKQWFLGCSMFGRTGCDFTIAAPRVVVYNAIRCRKCDDVIESTHRHDFKRCSCGAVAVDGGRDYLRRCGNRSDYAELSKERDGRVVVTSVDPLRWRVE